MASHRNKVRKEELTDADESIETSSLEGQENEQQGEERFEAMERYYGSDYDTPKPPQHPPNSTIEVLLSSYHIRFYEVAKRIVNTLSQTQGVIAVDCRGSSNKIVLVQVATCEGLCFIFDLHVCPAIMTQGQLGDLLSNAEIAKIMYDCSLYSSLIYDQYRVRLCNVFDTQCGHMVITSQYEHIHPYLVPPLSVNKVSCTYGRGLLNVAPHVIRRLASVNPNFWEKRPLTRKLCNYAARGALCLLPEVFTGMSERIQPRMQAFYKRMVTEKLAYPIVEQNRTLTKYNHHVQEAKKLKAKLDTMMKGDDNDAEYDMENENEEADSVDPEEEDNDDVDQDSECENSVPADPSQPPSSRACSRNPTVTSNTHSTGFTKTSNSTSVSRSDRRSPRKEYQSTPAQNTVVQNSGSPHCKASVKTQKPHRLGARKTNLGCHEQQFEMIRDDDMDGYGSEHGTQSTRIKSKCKPPAPRLLRSPHKRFSTHPSPCIQSESERADYPEHSYNIYEEPTREQPHVRESQSSKNHRLNPLTKGFPIKILSNGSGQLRSRPVSYSRWPKTEEVEETLDDGDPREGRVTNNRKRAHCIEEDIVNDEQGEAYFNQDQNEVSTGAAHAGSKRAKSQPKLQGKNSMDSIVNLCQQTHRKSPQKMYQSQPYVDQDEDMTASDDENYDPNDDEYISPREVRQNVSRQRRNLSAPEEYPNENAEVMEEFTDDDSNSDEDVNGE